MADAQRQGAPDNAMISIPIGELDQALEEVEELEAHRAELAANLRSVEAIAEVAKRDLREAELKRDYWRKAAQTNQETARQLAIDLEAAEKSADRWQKRSARDPSVQALEGVLTKGFRLHVTDDYETVEVNPIVDGAVITERACGPMLAEAGDLDPALFEAAERTSKAIRKLGQQSDHWSDHEARITRLEKAAGILTDDQAAEMFGPEEEEQDR